MKQSEVIWREEADAWYHRNKETMGQRFDEVEDLIVSLDIMPVQIMEVGCSSGWRLGRLKERYGCQTVGIEPGSTASKHARKYNNVTRVFRLTADHLPSSMTGAIDVLIYGFCLYLTDPDDWCHIVSEADRVLRPGGHLVIHDFNATRHVYAVPYEHRPGLLSYHFDFAQLWLANPLYSLVRRKQNKDDTITVLKKLKKTDIEVVT
jgi:SAM-dependent methyltransferase